MVMDMAADLWCSVPGCVELADVLITGRLMDRVLLCSSHAAPMRMVLVRQLEAEPYPQLADAWRRVDVANG